MDKKRGIILSGLVTFGSLFVLSIIYFKERIIFADPIFQLAYMVRDGDFAIQVNRFVALVSKIFPFIAIKLSLPLNIITLIYSMSFVFYNFIFFLIVVFYLKKYKWALILLLYNILMVSHSFYWPAIELNQGIGVMILFFAYLSKISDTRKINYVKLAIILGFVITIIFSHPLTIIPFTFILLYFFLFNKKEFNTKLIGIISLFSVITIIAKRLFFRNWYDDAQMHNLNNFIDFFPNYIYLQSNKDFLNYLITDYFITGILLIVLIIFLFKKRSFFKSVFILSFIIGYLFLVNISFPEGSPNFFAESKYLILSLFVSIPFVFEIYYILFTKYGLILLISIIIIRIIHINNTHEIYSVRLDWVRKIIDKTESLEHKKLIINKKDTPEEMLMLTWASAYEFWALSSIENNIPRSILIVENPSKFDTLLHKTDVFLEEWRVYKYENMPKKYFDFRDTSTYVKYRLD